MNNPNLVEYIRQNRDLYTREAIDKQLQDAGYRPEDIAAAWQEVESGTPGTSAQAATPVVVPPQQRTTRSPLFWLTMLVFILVSYGLPFLLVYLASLSNQDNTPLYIAALVIYAILQIAAIVTGVMLVRRNRPLAMGMMIGLVMTNFVLPFVGGVIVFGICIAQLSRV